MNTPYFLVLLKQFAQANTPQAMAQLDMSKVRQAADWAAQRIEELSPTFAITASEQQSKNERTA